jgi:prevent-host-death family protein
MTKPDSVVGAYAAKTHFSELLARVAQGEEVTITRHGAAVARMVPVKQRTSHQQRRAAIEAMRNLAKGNRLAGVKIRDLINEGRP